MRRKTKPIVPSPVFDKPVMCAKHGKRIAQVERLGMNMCWVCYCESVLEIIKGGFERVMVERKLARWIKEYEKRNE